MKYILAIGFSFISLLGLMAQSGFRNGYIIKNNNDTIYGLIKYKGNQTNTKKCIFKADKNENSQIFTPNDIKVYRFTEGKYYKSKSVNINSEPEEMFLEYLINGIVDVYYYRRSNGEDNYLVDDGSGNLYELKNEEQEVYINGTRYSKSSKEYVRILKVIFKDSPSVSKKAETTALSHRSLINIAHDYHNEVCDGEKCIIYERKTSKLKGTFGLMVGLNKLSVSKNPDFKSDIYYYMKVAEFDNNIYPSVGVYYKINLPFISEKIYFQYEGSYSQATITEVNSYHQVSSGWTYAYSIDAKLSAFDNVGVIRYEAIKGKIRPTFQFGVFYKYYFKTDYTNDWEWQFSWGDPQSSGISKDNPFSDSVIGIDIGLGFEFNYLKSREMFLDFKYQNGFGLLKINDRYLMNTNIWSVNLGIQIGK